MYGANKVFALNGLQKGLYKPVTKYRCVTSKKPHMPFFYTTQERSFSFNFKSKYTPFSIKSNFFIIRNQNFFFQIIVSIYHCSCERQRVISCKPWTTQSSGRACSRGAEIVAGAQSTWPRGKPLYS